ncbi:MAG TPA: energy transducer TonB [Chitinophagales bacterium]|nr:energy transducer TonB [Chitinophagales bacterium]
MLNPSTINHAVRNVSLVLVTILFAISISSETGSRSNADIIDQTAFARPDSTGSLTDSDQYSARHADGAISFTDTPGKNNSQSVSSYQKLQAETQSFSIDASRDTVIYCREGTSIAIKSHSFISLKTGAEISGSVNIRVQEYYCLSDMVLADLSTISNGQLLESAGMIHISAMYLNEECVLIPGKTFEIGFPYKERNGEMQLFYGKWDKETVNWQVEKKSLSEEVPMVFLYVEQMPEYPGGMKALKNFFHKNLKYPPMARASGIGGRVVVQFVVEKDGSVTDVKLVMSSDPELDSAALAAVRKLPKWKPGKLEDQPVRVYYRLPITFETGKMDSLFAERFEKIYSDSSIQKAPEEIINRYLFSATQFGWINCDRFWNAGGSKVNFTVEGLDAATDLKIVFHSAKSFMSGTRNNNCMVFSNVPENEEVTLIALKYLDGKPFLAMKETVTSPTPVKDLIFEPVTMNVLKSEMKRLDSIQN